MIYLFGEERRDWYYRWCAICFPTRNPMPPCVRCNDSGWWKIQDHTPIEF